MSLSSSPPRLANCKGITILPITVRPPIRLINHKPMPMVSNTQLRKLSSVRGKRSRALSVLLIVQSVRLLAQMGLDGGVQSVRWPGRREPLDWTDCRRLDGLPRITCFARFHAQRENDQNLLTVYKVE